MFKKRVGVALIISAKIELRSKTITGDEKVILMKNELVLQEDLRIVNIYAPNMKAPNL